MEDSLIGIIGGTGLEDALAEHMSETKTVEIDTPFGKTSSLVITGKVGSNRIALLNRHGPGHRLLPSEVPYAANVFALKKLGARVLISSGAVGSLRQEIKPGDLILVDQFIDKTYKRQSTFFTDFGAVHCEFAQPTCGRLRAILHKTAKDLGLGVHEAGTYVCMEGPQFSSRAESLMHRSWGGDLIGMTALPEAKLAREAQMCYALVALASDYDCWQQHEAGKDKQTLLKEIIGNLRQATDNCLALLSTVVRDNNQLIFDDCPCRKSLELAVWTQPENINPEEKEKLAVLFQ
jgi:5'-methylthioadenosine phosphorylase